MEIILQTSAKMCISGWIFRITGRRDESWHQDDCACQLRAGKELILGGNLERKSGLRIGHRPPILQFAQFTITLAPDLGWPLPWPMVDLDKRTG
jgi:hypothetical protein